MRETKAYEILGLSQDSDMAAIKKKYRRLMHLAHPDGEAFRKDGEQLAVTAEEINAAYACLCEREEQIKAAKKKREKVQKATWNAPVNKEAYCSRKVYLSAEDSDGAKIGDFSIAEGKFYWTEDEDFQLFLKSIFTCSKDLLDEAEEQVGNSMDAERRLKVQAELAYWLAVQFIDSIGTLKRVATEKITEKSVIYAMEATLEIADDYFCGDDVSFTPGERLYPSRISKHRLFARNENNREVGYLSFRDDRLYYVIIPLLERRNVQIKMQIRDEEEQSSGNSTGKKQRRNQSSTQKDLRLDLWVRFSAEQTETYPESISLRIADILRQYKEKLME